MHELPRHPSRMLRTHQDGIAQRGHVGGLLQAREAAQSAVKEGRTGAVRRVASPTQSQRPSTGRGGAVTFTRSDASNRSTGSMGLSSRICGDVEASAMARAIWSPAGPSAAAPCAPTGEDHEIKGSRSLDGTADGERATHVTFFTTPAKWSKTERSSFERTWCR